MVGSAHPHSQDLAIAGWPSGVAYDGGFRILGTPLGFDNAKGASLRFVSFVDSTIPTRGSRVLLSPFVAAAIDSERRGLDALHLGYNRKIRMGRMDIRMLPTGLGPGSSQIEIILRNRKIVYLDGLRLAAPLTTDPAEIPKCDVLLLDVKPGEPRPPSPRTLALKLAGWLQRSSAGRPLSVLLAANRAATLDVAWILRNMDIPIRVQRPLFEMIRRVEAAGVAVPNIHRLEQALPESGVVLHDAATWFTSALSSQTNLRMAYIGPGRTKPKWADVAFRLAENEDRPGIVSYVKKTGARDVALGLGCDEPLTRMLLKTNRNIYRVHRPEQMDLDF